MAGTLEIIELPAAHRPKEGRKPEQAQEKRNRDQNEEGVHIRALRRASLKAFPMTRSDDEDIAQLRRIQELTNEGLNLAGVQKVLELEAEVAALRQALADARAAAEEAVEETHRQYRRDLVPVKQTPVLWRSGNRTPSR